MGLNSPLSGIPVNLGVEVTWSDLKTDWSLDVFGKMQKNPEFRAYVVLVDLMFMLGH